jgi:RNA polymerase sigma factor (sigma-70 family)
LKRAPEALATGTTTRGVHKPERHRPLLVREGTMQSSSSNVDPIRETGRRRKRQLIPVARRDAREDEGKGDCLQSNRNAHRSRPVDVYTSYLFLCSVILFTNIWSQPIDAFSTTLPPRLFPSLHHILETTTTTLHYAHSKFETEAAISVTRPLEPLRQSSDDRRKRAVSAMHRAQVEQAVGVGNDLTIPAPYRLPDLRKRPKGRPESVPGAMAQETMARYQQQQQLLLWNAEEEAPLASEWELRVIAPYIAPPQTIASSWVAVNEVANVSVPNRPRQRKLKGSKDDDNRSSGEQLPVVGAKKITPRKRVFKNLPKSKERPVSSAEAEDVDRATMATKLGKGPANGMDIHQYYRTELLTSDEEYSLGMKIQFMDRCEQVHEGLAAAMNALPTIQEWAAACGFIDPDPNFVATEADEQLRPIGSDLMFEDMDPNLFVGNGLAHQTGPGRGRGRAKRPPPLRLPDFYDDSEYRVELKAYMNARKNGRGDVSITRPRKHHLSPINRGTPTDFVERLMTAHEAKQRMVQSNMRLVISIARKYANAGVNLQDLVQEGSLGLSRAAEKFEPKKGFKFSTYASWWIQQAVFRSIAYHSRTIRLPVHVHNLLNRVRKVRQALQSELGRAPTNEEIAEQLGMTRQKYNKMLHLTKRSISLEAPKYRSNPKDLGHESDDLLGDTISKSTVLEDEATPQKSVDHGLFHEDLRDMMKILDEDEHRVICARYGLQDGLTRTVTVVAAQMKQSKAWVRSQECRALRKLRRPWYEKKLKEHQDALAC